MCYVRGVTTYLGIRELRNNTADAVRLARIEGEVIITQHGRPVAVLRPYSEGWKDAAQRVLDSFDGPLDTGLAEALADSDATSADDLT